MKIIEYGRKLGMLEMLKKKLNTGENGERAVCGMLQYRRKQRMHEILN